MLKPYVYVVCEKVIIEGPTSEAPPSTSGPSSLINLFSKIIVEVLQGGKLPENAVGPKEWAIFSMWDAEPGDENKKLNLCTSIFYPDGKPFGEIKKLQLPVILGQRSQMVLRINAFPLGQAGFYTVRTWIEEEGQGPASQAIELQIELQVISKDTHLPQMTS